MFVVLQDNNPNMEVNEIKIYPKVKQEFEFSLKRELRTYADSILWINREVLILIEVCAKPRISHLTVL